MNIGVVVIGRNEGERLGRCLTSVFGVSSAVVYVDSDSTDNSVEIARSMGADVVDLDMVIPFTAARARNEGFSRLNELIPALQYVQFVDGDCELVEGWLFKAAVFLEDQPEVAMVCGRLRERFPQQSVYNMLCDIEWDTPVGEAKACGGIAMARADVFERAGGYMDNLIAGEEPELCVRLRQSGWKVWRLDEQMAWHDAAITRFGQWWRRMVRGGYAFAEGAHLHGAPPERHWVRESRSSWLWGGAIPLLAFVAVLAWGAWGLLFLAIYPLQVIRLAQHGRRSKYENWWRAYFMVLGKFPEMQGQMKFLLHRLLGRRVGLIEYK